MFQYQRKKAKRKKPKSKFEKQVGRLDVWFSRFIRLKAAAPIHGDVHCITCHRIEKWDSGKIHCGHFIGKSNKTMHTRWDYRNVGPQCVVCNSFEEGNKYLFGKYLESIYGKGICRILKIDSTRFLNMDLFDIENKIKEYISKSNKIAKEKGLSIYKKNPKKKE